jgi:hypothetical protein
MSVTGQTPSSNCEKDLELKKKIVEILSKRLNYMRNHNIILLLAFKTT